MKTAFILLAFVACAFAANGTFTQKVCSDAKCSKGCQSNSFPEGYAGLLGTLPTRTQFGGG